MTITSAGRFLTDYIAGHKGDQDFVARLLAPAVNIGSGRKFRYRDWGTGMFRSEGDEDLAGAKSPANIVDLQSTLVSDDVIQHKLGDFIPQIDLDEANADGQTDAHRMAIVDGIVNKIKLAEEVRLATLIEATGNVSNTAATAVWGNASATPLADIEGAIEAVRTASGKRANTLVIPAGNLKALLSDDDIVDWRKRNAVISAVDMLKHMFRGIEKVIIPTAVKVSSAEGQAETTADVWDDAKMWAMYIPNGNADRFNQMPLKTFTRQGAGFNADGMLVDVLEERNPAGERVIVYSDYLAKIVDSTAIYMLTGCTS